MNVLVVERHVVYLQADTSSGPRGQEQTHLRVQIRRLPWRFDSLSGPRSVFYTTAGQLHGMPTSVSEREPRSQFHLENIRDMRKFLMGEGYAHGKVIVARIPDPERDLVTREQMAKKLLADRTNKFLRTHRPHPPANRRNEAWMFYDPTRPGIKSYPRDTWLREVKKFFAAQGLEVVRGLAQGSEKRRKVFLKNAVIPLGIAYRIGFYGNQTPPSDIVHDAEVERRVNTHLSAGSKFRRSIADPLEDWYAMGVKDVPVLSKRNRPTVTWQHGRGFVPVGDKDVSSRRPILLVKATGYEDARLQIALKIRKLAERDRVMAARLYGQWLETGKTVLPRRAVDMMVRHRRQQR